MRMLHSVCLLTTGFLSVLAFAGTSSAQKAVVKDARFALTHKAEWVGTTLSPGTYTLSVNELSSGLVRLYQVRFAGEGRATTILAKRAVGPEAGKTSKLVLLCAGEDCAVRALHLHDADLVFEFPKPNTGQLLEAKGPEITESVAVLTAVRK